MDNNITTWEQLMECESRYIDQNHNIEVARNEHIKAFAHNQLQLHGIEFNKDYIFRNCKGQFNGEVSHTGLWSCLEVYCKFCLYDEDGNIDTSTYLNVDIKKLDKVNPA